METAALRAPRPVLTLEPQDEVELTTVRVPDFARIGSAQRTVNALRPGAAARAGLPDPSPVRPLAGDLAAAAAPSATPRAPYRERPEVRAFIDRMVDQHGVDRVELERLIFAVTPPPPSSGGVAEGLPWWQYRQRFITPELRQRGIEFARTHDQALRDITRDYRVDRRAILGIAGVETRYGGFTGNVRVLPALTRLAFDDERRQDYFRSELEALVLLAREHRLDLHTLEGSYAGALGIPQFMPSNYRNLA
ncbi:MAG TPA: lytic murein transglycosylase, partial [Myxococcota bacterium]|nr:lytic murein transglycosylase [Myxococcota bacterium]